METTQSPGRNGSLKARKSELALKNRLPRSDALPSAYVGDHHRARVAASLHFFPLFSTCGYLDGAELQAKIDAKLNPLHTYETLQGTHWRYHLRGTWQGDLSIFSSYRLRGLCRRRRKPRAFD